MHTFDELAAFYETKQEELLSQAIEECLYFFHHPIMVGRYLQGATGTDTKLIIPFVIGIDALGKKRFLENILSARGFEHGEHSRIEGSIEEHMITFEKRYIYGTNTQGKPTKNPNIERFSGRRENGLYHGHWSFHGGDSSLHNDGTFELGIVSEDDIGYLAQMMEDGNRKLQ